MNPYKTITGRTLDVSVLSSTEKRALETLTEAYDRRPDWEEFSDLWQDTLRPILSKLRPPEKRTRHPLYRIAQDLEMRLGIAQGAVAEPDYRDYLLDQIEDQFGSRYRFCKKADIPEAFLSQVLSGKKDFSVEMLRRAARTLNLGLALLPKADFAQPWGNTLVALRQVISLVVSDLARVTAVHDTLRRYRTPARRLQALARERSILGDLLMDDLSRELEAIPPGRRAEEVLRLLEDRKEKLEAFLKILRRKAAALADQPAVLSKGEQPRGGPALLRV
jgi:hypothetical protein